jgi:PhnB protein
MKALNITLMFDGQTEAVFNFYKSVFGGEFTALQRMKDMPGRGADLPADQKEKILFMSLPLAKGALSGMDMPAGMPPVVAGTNFTISLDLDSEGEVTKVFNGLAKGGQVRFPLGPQFWATYFGMLTDQYGVTWMLTYNK